MQEIPLFELVGPDDHKWELYENGTVKGFPEGTFVINNATPRINALLARKEQLPTTGIPDK